MTEVITFIVFWLIVVGLPFHLFTKYKITYHQNFWPHTVGYILALVALVIVYQEIFKVYFSHNLGLTCFGSLFLFLFWLSVPKLYARDHLSKTERWQFQVIKFFQVLFQQLCFLGGLLTLGLMPFQFGLVFFIIHIPIFLFLPFRFSILFVAAAFFGGQIFAHIQLVPRTGFVLSFAAHILFYFAFNYGTTSTGLLNILKLNRAIKR